MNDSDFKEVDFATYCSKCEYDERNEIYDPCNDCLDVPVRAYTDKPLCFKDKES